MKVLLTRKYADRIDGVDLQGRHPGDLLDLQPEQANLLIAERWAIPERREQQSPSANHRRADDCPPQTAKAES